MASARLKVKVEVLCAFMHSLRLLLQASALPGVNCQKKCGENMGENSQSLHNFGAQ